MTISTILGLGARSTTSTPAFHIGQRPLYPGSGYHAQHRGDIWIHSDGWKGGVKSKGDSAALSALTLLAFLFFLNILQSCLQDMQPTFMMASSAAGGREEVPAMVAMPVAMPVATPMPSMPVTRSRRQAVEDTEPPDSKVPISDEQELCDVCDGDSGAGVGPSEQRSEGAALPSGDCPTDEVLKEDVDKTERTSAEPELLEQGRGMEKSWQMVPVVEPRRPLVPVSMHLTTRHSATPGAELERVVSITPASVSTVQTDKPTASLSLYRLADLASGGAISGFTPTTRVPSTTSIIVPTTSSEELDSSAGSELSQVESKPEITRVHNKQEEYDLDLMATVAPLSLSTAASSGGMAFVPPRITLVRPGGQMLAFVPLGGALGGALGSSLGGTLVGSMGSTFRSVAWRALSAVTRPFMQLVSPRLRSALCCDLVLCETRRIARVRERQGLPGGAIGERLAGALSGLVSWACGGEADTGAALREESAHDGCRQHIQQCEMRAGRRTPVSTIAAILEAYVGM